MKTQGPQGHSVSQDRQGQSILLTNEASGPQGTDNQNRSVIGATSVSKIQIDNSLKNSLHSLLQDESPYADILQELQNGSRQVIHNSLVFKRMNGILFIHDPHQDTDLDFWRIVVPENSEIKSQVVQELHCTPYSAHPGIQRTIARVKRSFYWKGMVGDI